MNTLIDDVAEIQRSVGIGCGTLKEAETGRQVGDTRMSRTDAVSAVWVVMPVGRGAGWPAA